MLKIELPDHADVAKQTVVAPPKMESLASPQKARREIEWTGVEEVHVCKDDPYTSISRAPTCSAVDGALHRLGTDDIEDPECVSVRIIPSRTFPKPPAKTPSSSDLCAGAAQETVPAEDPGASHPGPAGSVVSRFGFRGLWVLLSLSWQTSDSLGSSIHTESCDTTI